MEITSRFSFVCVSVAVLLFDNVSANNTLDEQCRRIFMNITSAATGNTQRIFNAVCENLGRQVQVPVFPADFNGAYELTIRNDTTIVTIQDRAFESLLLTRLVLVGLNIVVIEVQAFEELETTLEYLNLASNRVASLFSKTFSSLEKLKTLILDGNQLTVLPEGLFATPHSLESIHLSRNNVSLGGHRLGLFWNQTYLQSLYLGGNNLGYLADGTFDSLENLGTLDLSRNDLNVIELSTFRAVRHLTRLNMSRNRLETLSVNACYHLEHLVEFDVSFNEIVSLSGDSFRGCPTLKLLNMSGNRISDLPDQVLGVLRELDNLELSGNFLTTIRMQLLRNLSLLDRLNLDRNQIEDLAPGTFAFNDKLSFLNLSSNRISSLNFAMFSAANSLALLDLSRNFLEFDNITLLLRSLTRLKYLNLSRNRLRGAVTDGLFQNQNLLIYLDLSYNNISQLNRRSFSGLRSLVQLVLDQNRIAVAASDAFSDNVKLTLLSIVGNNVYDITGLLSNSVRSLYADRNNLTTLVLSEYMTSLQELYLTRNRITEVKVMTNATAKFALKILDLGENQLESFNLSHFLSNAASLESLYLRNNRINEIHMESRLESSNLRVLDLSDNCLETFQYDNVSKFLSQLSLARNPLRCSCDLPWLTTYDPLVDRNSTLCLQNSTGSTSAWVYLTCISTTNCSYAQLNLSAGVAACPTPANQNQNFSTCYLNTKTTATSNDNTSTVTPVDTNIHKSASGGVTVPVFVYIILGVLGVIFLACVVVCVVAKRQRATATLTGANRHPVFRHFARPPLAETFENFKVPSGHRTGRTTSFQFGWLNSFGKNNASSYIQ